MNDADPNAVQREYWNTRTAWIDFQDRMDSQLEDLGRAAIERLGGLTGATVLDIGCGCGHTSLQLREAGAARVVGLDISVPMLAVATERVTAGGIDGVTFRAADVQVDDLGGPYDAVYSRFGVMFFSDPVAAFARTRAATRPGGSMSFVCWQGVADNPWMTVPNRAAMTVVEFPSRGENAADPFAFSDPDHVRSILADAGWSDVEITDFRREVQLGGGASLEDTVELMIELGPSKAALEGRDTATHEAVRAAIGDALAPHQRDGGVWLPSATWVVTARA